MTGRSFLLALLLCASGAAGAADELATAVLFNTVCADCHDLECSGRVSSLCQVGGVEKARGHMERHAGPVGGETAEGLFRLLERTKTDCVRVFPAVLQPADGRWTEEALRLFAAPDRRGWFVPLGKLEPGSHRIVLSGGSEGPIRVDLLAGPERLVCTEISGLDAETPLSFKVEEPGEVFLRLRSASPFRLTRVAK